MTDTNNPRAITEEAVAHLTEEMRDTPVEKKLTFLAWFKARDRQRTQAARNEDDANTTEGND
ncbi:hypothetical protein [Gordonia amicalis]|uniref:hypothetical protein n=1 Tax=Gordonia amicalis TaxID=89053 RepID=UPI0004112D30|nr:hypothetical protein [Gordonia amicalis]